MAFNCARVYVGSYIGGGTNELEEFIGCNYKVVNGAITRKRLQPTIIGGTNSEGTMFALNTFILYPKSETALVVINRGKHTEALDTTGYKGNRHEGLNGGR